MSLPTKQVRRASARIALVDKYFASGLTPKAFCQRENLVYATFQSWLRKYRAAQCPSPISSPGPKRFIPLRVPLANLHAAPSCTLEYPNGVRVHFSGTVDAHLLSHLLQATGAKS